MIQAKVMGISSLVILVGVLSSGPLQAQPTVIGTIVEVNPDARTLLLQVGVSEGEPILRRFRLADSARIRLDGGFGRLADVVVGQTARILYARVNGASVAEGIDITTAPPAGSGMSQAARAATGIEERRRYLDEVERTLDVLEESVEELSQFPEIEGTTELARRGAAVEELQSQIEGARNVLASLSPTAGQEVWALGVDRMTNAHADLTAAHERAWSIIGNR